MTDEPTNGTPTHADERGETAAARLDRQWTELLQELRVMQTGLHLLSGFLLTLPFQNRFADLGPTLRVVFLTAVGAATLATAVVVGPVALHRHWFRGHLKDVLVQSGHVMAQLGLALLGVTIVAVTWLVFGFVLGDPWGPVGAGVAAVAFSAVWLALPRALGSGPTPSGPYGAADG